MLPRRGQLSAEDQSGSLGLLSREIQDFKDCNALVLRRKQEPFFYSTNVEVEENRQMM